MLYIHDIERMFSGVSDFDADPSETLEMLHIRSELYEVSHLLTKDEKEKLHECDCILFENIQPLLGHLQAVHNFQVSTRSYKEWWWHLDKVASGMLTVSIKQKNG